MKNSERIVVEVVFCADAVLVVEAEPVLVLPSALVPCSDALTVPELADSPVVPEVAAELLLVPVSVPVDAVADRSELLLVDSEDDTPEVAGEDASEVEPEDVLVAMDVRKDVTPPMADTADSLAEVGEDDAAVLLIMEELEPELVVLSS